MAQRASERRPEDIRRRAAESEDFRVLFDIEQPAQVHLFRNAIAELQSQGYETLVTSRETDATEELLDAYGIEHRSLSTRVKLLPRFVDELLIRKLRLLGIVRAFRPSVIVSRLDSVPAHVSALSGTRYVAVSDTNVDRSFLHRLSQRLTVRFVDTVCVPERFQLSVDPENRRSLDFQELAYLHPHYFQPDPRTLDGYDIDPTETFFVIDVGGLDAYHGVSCAAPSPETIRRLVRTLSPHGRVCIPADTDLPADLTEYQRSIDPEAVQQLLSFADLYIGVSETMATEAAMLGTPAIRTTSNVDEHDESVSRALEEQYDLLRSSADDDRAVRTARRTVEFGIDNVDWQRRRDQLIAEQPDVTERIVTTILESAPAEQRLPRHQ